MNNKHVGSIGMTKVITRFLELNYQVFTEVSDNSEIDLIAISEDNELLKIQVKTISKVFNNKMCFGFLKCRRNTKKYIKTRYTNQVDYFAVCCLENNYIGLIPFKDTLKSSSISLRINKTKNNQSKNIHYAEDYKL